MAGVQTLIFWFLDDGDECCSRSNRHGSAAIGRTFPSTQDYSFSNLPTANSSLLCSRTPKSDCRRRRRKKHILAALQVGIRETSEPLHARVGVCLFVRDYSPSGKAEGAPEYPLCYEHRVFGERTPWPTLRTGRTGTLLRETFCTTWWRVLSPALRSTP